MADERLIDTQWVDVLPPVPPEPLPVWIWLSIILLCLGIALLAWLHWQRRPRQQALRQLRRCERQLQRNQIKTKPIAAQVYRAVQLGVRRLPSARMHAHDADWQNYYRRLAQCAFHAHEPDAQELRDILRETRAWLRGRG